MCSGSCAAGRACGLRCSPALPWQELGWTGWCTPAICASANFKPRFSRWPKLPARLPKRPTKPVCAWTRNFRGWLRPSPADRPSVRQQEVVLTKDNLADGHWETLGSRTESIATMTSQIPARAWNLTEMHGPLSRLALNARRIGASRRQSASFWFCSRGARRVSTQPSWMGYSVGKWQGDTLTVETIGFNEASWLDTFGHPRSELVRIREAYHRRDFGHMDLEVTLEDPKYYTRPFTLNTQLNLIPDSDVLEFVCGENEKDRAHLDKW